MIELIITVVLVVGVSSLCSTTEAMLYSLSWTHIEKLKADGKKSGNILYSMRTNVDRPISAILTLNTVANTAGATIAGALASDVLGVENFIYFSIILTLLILVFGEILPKTFGVIYTNVLAPVLVYFLQAIILLLSPITYFLGLLTRLITPKEVAPTASEDDIKILASISRKSGTINDYEESTIANVLTLDKKRVYDVMTPRTVVFSLPMSLKLTEAYNHEGFWSFSRIPVYASDNEDLVGIVQRREIERAIRNGKSEETLDKLMQPIHFVLESQSLDQVLHNFLDLHQHLFAVLDEYGGLAGVISLEDILEELLGREIVDESDITDDMRELAQKRKEQVLMNNKNLINAKNAVDKNTVKSK